MGRKRTACPLKIYMSMISSELNAMENDFEGLEDHIDAIIDKWGKDKVIGFLEEELEFLKELEDEN